MSDFLKDLVDSLGPDKGLRVLVVLLDVTLNRLDQVFDALEAAPSDLNPA
jgi:hypothetical protein